MVTAVYAIKWTEHEFGQRPDGLSLHASRELAQKFLAEHQGGTREQYWSGSDPQLMEVDTDIAQMVDVRGSMWANSTGWSVDRNFIDRTVNQISG